MVNIHTAEEQGTEAMVRLFAQANADQHNRGDRVAGQRRGRDEGSVVGDGGEARKYRYREMWKGSESGTRERGGREGEDSERGRRSQKGTQGWEREEARGRRRSRRDMRGG